LDSGERAPTSGHRDDLQGLRAIAVLVVMLNHAGVHFMGGGYVGVDVFFVLSGFLITGLLLNEAYRHRSVSIAGFYKRRVRRILPAAALTLVSTIVAAYYLLNFVRARAVVTDAIWSSVFAANIHFARIGTDYFARNQPPSPLQHFWTLSVEEQFYVVWPALLGIVLFGRRFTRKHQARVSIRALHRLLAVAIALAGASLVWSILQTRTNMNAAYFSTLTRGWELGLGAVLAVGFRTVVRIDPRARDLGGFVGVAMILAAAVLYTHETPFPGYAALVPSVGAALVIAAGIGRASTVGRGLSVWPMRFVGDRSYTLYLWHWPVLILATEYVGHQISVATNLLLLVLALAISCVTYQWYENPIRRQQWSGQATIFAASAAVASVILVAGVATQKLDAKGLAIEMPQQSVSAPADLAQRPAIVSAKEEDLLLAAGDTSAKGLPEVAAAVKAAAARAPLPAGLTPPISGVENDHYVPPSGCAAYDGETTSNICRLDDRSAGRTVVLIGDSHALMWLPAVLTLPGWTVVPLAKTACTPDKWRTSGECGDWYRWMVRQAKHLHPHVVLISGAYGGDTGGTARAALDGITGLGGDLSRTAKHVIVIADDDGISQQPVDCLLRSDANMQTCTTSWTQDQFQANDTLAQHATEIGLGFIHTRGWFCSGYECPMVVGHTIVYRDTGHITTTYAAELAPVFRRAFAAAIR